MSYILEALKKVERERELEQVPDLHSRHDQPMQPPRRWPWVLAAALLLNAVLVAALWWRGANGPGEAARPVQGSTDAVAEDVPSRVVMSPSTSSQTPPEPSTGTEALAAETDRADGPTAVLDTPPSVIPQRPLRPLPLVDPLPPPQSPSARADEPGQADQPAVPDPSASARLTNPSEIVELRAPSVPPQPREEPAWKTLPRWPLVPSGIARQVNGRLVLNAHFFSENPEDRFVLLNMKKYTAGEQIAEGPELEEITRDGVILTVPEGRFRLTSQ